MIYYNVLHGCNSAVSQNPEKLYRHFLQTIKKAGLSGRKSGSWNCGATLAFVERLTQVSNPIDKYRPDIPAIK